MAARFANRIFLNRNAYLPTELDNILLKRLASLLLKGFLGSAPSDMERSGAGHAAGGRAAVARVALQPDRKLRSGSGGPS